MLTIRLMQAQDADAVRQVDRLAFLAFSKKQNPSGPYPVRTRDNILAALSLCPQGCFVAEENGRLVGYLFSHVWGEVGWVGVFGVHPEHQGAKVGKQLLAEGVGVLEAAGCTTIGLETMPDSPYNLGLYSRRGFQPLTLTLVLEKEVRAPLQDAYRLLDPGIRLPDSGTQCDLEQVTVVSRAAWSEQDLRPEVENALRHRWGEVLLLGPVGDASSFWGFAVMRMVHRREGERGEPLPNEICEVSVLSCLPEARQHLAQMLQECESFAVSRSFKSLRVTLNSADWQSLQVVLGEGYRVVHSSVRMVLRGSYGPQPGIEFSRWAM